MGLIKKAADIEVQPTVKMMIYGQAGMGKTTLALSAPKPLLLDFDNGVKRVNNAHLADVDVVQVTQWKEIKDLLEKERAALEPYETIVVDTVGKMIDFIITYCVGTRQPKIQDWSKINAEYQWLCRELGNIGKNLIFVAHRDTRREGEETVFVPSIREKNYNAIVTELDLLGYVEMKSDRGVPIRTITFDPTARNDGKNTCGLPSVMTIPEVITREGKVLRGNDFVTTQVMDPYRRMLEEKSQMRKAYDALMADLKGSIAGIDSADMANAFVAEMKNRQHIGNSRGIAGTLFNERIKQLGLTLDPKTKQYVDTTATD